jgi:ABC-type sugar transport system ATPase subunit
MSAQSDPVLSASGISKRFGATRALSDVSFTVRAGERVAIMGENGAGKSTLMKIFAGVHTPEAGSMTLRGENYAPQSPTDAIEAGVSTVYQEPSGFSHMTVLENLYMGRQITRRGGWLDKKAMAEEAGSLLSRLALPAKLLERRMGALSLAEQQQVLIARAVAHRAQVLILDEPTSILTDTEADRLFATVDQLSAGGTAICYITHRFDELDRVADRFIVLRDGRNAGETDSPDRDQLLRMMGSVEELAVDPEDGFVSSATTATKGPAQARSEPVLAVDGLTSAGTFQDVSLEVRPGQIVGLYGLVGAGRSELALALFGELPVDSGTITYLGRPYRPRSSRVALGMGIAYLPEDRKTQGIFPHMTVGENLAAAALGRVSRRGLLSVAGESRLTTSWMKDLAIKAEGAGVPITSLSGGNQQKVLLARLMATQPKLLMLDEPTRGIDVGTKKEIHRRIRELADDGMAVLLITSEMAELLGLSDTVHVLHEGRMSRTLSGAEITETTILRAATGLPV